MKMSRKPKDIPMWAKLNHGRPVTRRDFLATGIIPFSAVAFGPSLLTLLNPSSAFALDAASCAGSSGTGFIPLITLNLSGGPSLASQIVAKNLNGENLKSYTKVGQGSGPMISYNVEKEFGSTEWAGTAIGGNTQGLVSKFLTGMRSPRGEMTRNPALDKTAFIWTAVALADDTAANPIDITGMALKMGLQGSKLPNLGRSDTATGINQKSAVLPPPAPFVVGSVNDLTNALGYASALTSLKPEQKTSLARVIASLTGSQVARLGQTSGNTAVSQLVECAGIRNIDLIASGGGDINPYAVGGTVTAEITRIWGVQANDRTSQNAIFGAMVYNGLVGNAATINLNLGGYDYHDGTRTTGDARDLAAGQVIGKILETANSLKKPVFVYVCADGATSSGEGLTADTAWMSDRGIAGLNYSFAFHPDKRPETSGSQIGGFNDGQAADGKFPTGSNPELAAQAVFANYAAWNGKTDFLEQYRILGDSALRSQAIKIQKG
jgi:hypothetical protein